MNKGSAHNGNSNDSGRNRLPGDHGRGLRPGRRILSLVLWLAAALTLMLPAAAAAKSVVYVASAFDKDGNNGGYVAWYDVGSGVISHDFGGVVGDDTSDVMADIAFTPDGQHAYVANDFGISETNLASIYQYDVNSDGSFAPMDPASVTITESTDGTNVGTLALAVSPDGASLYAKTTNGDNRVAQYSIGDDGTLTSKGSLLDVGGSCKTDAGAAPCHAAIAITPDGSHAYVTNWGVDDSITQYSIDAYGILMDPGSVVSVTNPTDIALSPDGKHAFVTSWTGPSAGKVYRYDIGIDGLLGDDFAEMEDTGGGPMGIAASPDGRSVYVANKTGGSISQYRFDSSGTDPADLLTPMGSVGLPGQGSKEGWNVSVSLDGGSVYATVYDDVGGWIAQYSREVCDSSNYGALGDVVAMQPTGWDPRDIAETPPQGQPLPPAGLGNCPSPAPPPSPAPAPAPTATPPPAVATPPTKTALAELSRVSLRVRCLVRAKRKARGRRSSVKGEQSKAKSRRKAKRRLVKCRMRRGALRRGMRPRLAVRFKSSATAKVRLKVTQRLRKVVRKGKKRRRRTVTRTVLRRTLKAKRGKNSFTLPIKSRYLRGGRLSGAVSVIGAKEITRVRVRR